ncbi:glycosyltransferase [Brevibacillus migulae]|uniref:glycosyltransferase n=1 Tax=Brevibacillus migulae TaxID=1644114 RepID=UPI001F2DF14C|nr:glycosyltransferase [Brevibacillus migulae]
MRIAIFDRWDSGIFPGGDTVQINAIASFLAEKGFYVKIFNSYKVNLNEFDVVFIFNLTRPFEAYIQAKECLKQEKPYILFPVYWDLDSLKMPDEIFSPVQFIPNSVKSRLRPLVFWKNNRVMLQNYDISFTEINSVEKAIRYILNHAKYICPNSYAEMEHLIERFGVHEIKDKNVVLLNGIDTRKIVHSSKHDMDIGISLPDHYLCSVGGIGPRKNQLNLVRAAKMVDIPLVIIGRASKDCEKYAEKVFKTAGNNVTFIDHLQQETVFQIMKKSKGHMQTSFIETPGLASIEALALGRPIGVSDVAPVREYFEELAIYCNPHEPQSIATSMEKLFYTEHEADVDVILDRFDWHIVLDKLISLLSSMEGKLVL